MNVQRPFLKLIDIKAKVVNEADQWADLSKIVTFISMKFRSQLCLLLLVLLCFVMCKPKKAPIVARDQTITAINAVTKLYIDSLQMEQFILAQELQDSAAQRLRNFYNSRNFQFAWLSENGLTEQARSFFELDARFTDKFRDSAFQDQQVSLELASLSHKDTTITKITPAMANLELHLTQHFFDFVNYTYGGKLDPAALQWYIPRKKVDAVALLDSLITKKGNDLEEWEPVNNYYKTLNTALERWYLLQQSGTMEKIVLKKAVYKEKDSAKLLILVKKRLADYSFVPPTDSSAIFNKNLTTAIKQAQQQFGLRQTGRLDAALADELNVPVTDRIEQMLINLERMRWMPVISYEKIILVNIPEYKLHVFENQKELFNMGIVVGKAANKTVIFSNELKNVVFSPYWNIPSSIVREEIWPKMKTNSRYLQQKNMEQTGTSNGLPIVRQKPGQTNALGRVKFLFPNSYNIYLHDTPSKSLFAEQNRAFSHGCIRLAEPKKLAEYVLADQSQWTNVKIDKAMQINKETWVTLKQPIPVFITYFTSWVDKNGLLNFRKDLYGHDKKMATQLFNKKT